MIDFERTACHCYIGLYHSRQLKRHNPLNYKGDSCDYAPPLGSTKSLQFKLSAESPICAAEQ